MFPSLDRRVENVSPQLFYYFGSLFVCLFVCVFVFLSILCCSFKVNNSRSASKELPWNQSVFFFACFDGVGVGQAGKEERYGKEIKK